jgi:hypothetical protein
MRAILTMLLVLTLNLCVAGAALMAAVSDGAPAASVLRSR